MNSIAREQDCATNRPRYTNIEFPDYPHIPGKTPHPNKRGGHSFNKPEPKCLGLQESFWNNKCFFFGVDLFNYSYYWESHVYWEGVWHKSNHIEIYDCFLKAIIKIAAGLIKKNMGQISVANDLWEKSKILLQKKGKMIPQELNPHWPDWEDFFSSLQEESIKIIPIKMLTKNENGLRLQIK